MPLVNVIEPSISRLLQARLTWDEAAANYFDPDRFLLSLQNCITLARTVTFVLQANKNGIPNFERWYEPYQEKWRNDPVMVWAREARNAIEKRGDLTTRSQIRGRIIASYSDDEAIESNWASHPLFATPQQVFASIPARMRIPHVRENGALLIERRWIDAELPDIEVLEAVAHVYGELARMLADLASQLNLSIHGALAGSKPDAMGKLAMDRAIYLSMRDGSLIGRRHFERLVDAPGEARKQRLIRRYGTRERDGLRSANTFREFVEAYFDAARVVMLRDHFHRNFLLLLRGRDVVRLIATEFPNRACKYVMMRDFARLARIHGADGVLLVGESWTAHGADVPRSGFAADAANRGEALTVHAANASGEQFSLMADVERKKIKRWKVKRLSPTRLNTGFQYMLMPFLREWGCVDTDELDQSFKRQEEMGIKFDYIPRRDG
jgi:hypothetical protein